MRVEFQQLKSFLPEWINIKEEKIKELEKKSGGDIKKFEEFLLREKLISEDNLLKLKAYILGIPFVNLEKEIIDEKVLQLIPESIAREYNIIAYKQKGNILEVAMIDPENLQAIDFIKKKTGLKIMPRLTNQESIKNSLAQYKKGLEAEFKEMIREEKLEKPALSVEREAGEEAFSKEDLEKIAEDLPIISVVDKILQYAISSDASDIHIEPMEKETLIRYRIDGILRDVMILPRQIYQGIVARIKVLANLRLDEHRLPQDGRFKVETPEYKVSFRVSILPVYDGEKIVMRLLPEIQRFFKLEDLGLWGLALKILRKNIKKPLGMILVTGPTGSGKTTTLYTILQILNTSDVNISTIEDPIEYRIPRINQTQVKPQIGLTFANGLRSLVRQDPDIIMVGEIRDNETASLAVNAALTGHLVLSTLHTNSAAGAIPRLIDMEVEPFLISSTLNVVVAQRLVRKLCDNKEKYKPSKAELDLLKAEFDVERLLEILRKEKLISKSGGLEDIYLFKPKSSKECADGYKGRMGIYEVLDVSPKIKEMIVKRATSDEIEAQAKKEKMVTMLEDGFVKAVKGLTTLEEVLRVTRE